MECITENIRKVRRNWAWTTLTLLSLTVMCSILDSSPVSNLSLMELFGFGISCISLVISMIMTAMHYIEYLKRFVGGTLFELVMAVVLLGLWLPTTVLIQDPRNGIASTVRPNGVEWVKQANLYVFTWFALFSNVYLVGSFIRNYKTYDLRVVGWISLLAGSSMLLGVSSCLKSGICDADDGHKCFRIKYAMVSSVILIAFSLIASVLSYRAKLSSNMGLVLSSPTAAIYSFTTGMLTSANGPGSALGTIYFTVWIGTAISILLLIGEFNNIFLYEEEGETVMFFQKEVEDQMGEENVIASTKKNSPEVNTNIHEGNIIASTKKNSPEVNTNIHEGNVIASTKKRSPEEYTHIHVFDTKISSEGAVSKGETGFKAENPELKQNKTCLSFEGVQRPLVDEDLLNIELSFSESTLPHALRDYRDDVNNNITISNSTMKEDDSNGAYNCVPLCYK